MPTLTLSPEQFTTPDNAIAQVPPLAYEHHKQREHGRDTTVILIHGAGLHHLSWPPQLRRLPNATVYAVDLPGHGASLPIVLKAGKTVTIDEYAAVINGTIHHLSLPNVVLVGHSMGAAIAMTCALAAQEESLRRLAGLVVVGAGATMPVNQRIFTGLTQDFAGMTAKLIDWMYGPEWPDRYRLRALEELRKNQVAQLLADFAACNAFDVRDRLATLQLPTLIICGEEDKMTPVAYSRELAEMIPQSELSLIPHCGHMAMLEKPAIVTERIQTFLDTQFTPD
ncbi:MAG TPA: alpha/beta hydrolase [Caldilineaceae bacterium]|nr:alpha/beta hydrolase [Caldilineaceae bacterium]